MDEIFGKIMKRFFVFALNLLIWQTGSVLNAGELKLLSQNSAESVYQWELGRLEIQKIRQNGVLYHQVSFSDAISDAATPDERTLPWQSFNLGIPENGQAQVRIQVEQLETRSRFLLAPPLRIYKDERGISTTALQTETPPPLTRHQWVEIGAPYRFRDMMIQPLTIHPLQYDAATHTLRVLKKARITVRISGEGHSGRSFRQRGKLDALYKNMLINFDQAAAWQLPRANRRLAKLSGLTRKQYHTFTINRDGVYKITAAGLRAAGLGDGMPLDQIQLFNNGGHELSRATNAGRYNPSVTAETPLYMVDANQDGLFNGNDYFLFYGRHVNGWFYEDGKKDFQYQMHTYDTENTYILDVSGTGGKRMTASTFPSLNNPVETDYGTFRYHYEKDLYNLLNSGPDWYGYRFFGLSNTYNFDIALPDNTPAGESATMVARFKGATGIHYLEPSSVYKINLSLNGAALLNNFQFTGGARPKATREIPAGVLKSGANAVSIQFTGSDEAAVAHLDYISLIYQARLTAVNNYLTFFTTKENTAMRYKVSGLTTAADWQIWDITDVLNPLILRENGSPQNGMLEIDVAEKENPKQWLVFSPSLSPVSEVREFNTFTPYEDLLSAANQADYIIITRRSLLDDAAEFAAMRPALGVKTVNVEDIEFYFNSGVQDPTAIRNFLRYAYNNWQTPSVSYVLLLGDGHYDYRHITIKDSSVVPVFEIYDTSEIDSRECDAYFGDLVNTDNSASLRNIRPDLAIGRLPVENSLDAQVMLEKIRTYEANPARDGWQMEVTLVADDTTTSAGKTEPWLHQPQTERLVNETPISKFNLKKIYLTAYPAVPGGRGILKPGAQRDIINQFNNGTLIINYVGHGSPTTWAHETVFNFDRDYSSINNPDKYPFLVAATCDFGMFDNPFEISFTEGLIWKKNAGIIGALVSTRLVYSQQNARFNRVFYQKLFPEGGPSIELGAAMLQAQHSTSGSNVNDQKYHLLADPTMTLIDPREKMQVSSIQPDTLKALATVEIDGAVETDGKRATDFNGGAVIIVNDARYEDVNTGGGKGLNYDLPGPLLFKGEVSVEQGALQGRFIVPKSLRYQNRPTGRVSIYAWDDNSARSAMAFRDDLLFIGSENRGGETDGPGIDIYFKNQENFSDGDMVQSNPILIIEMEDENGINVTGQLGHRLELRIDNGDAQDVSAFFKYDRDSYTRGRLEYPLTALKSGRHTLQFSAYDNLNNLSEQTIAFTVADEDEPVLDRVMNYPNPFRRATRFTFQTSVSGAEVTVKIYTLQGRIIQELTGYVSTPGFNVIEWDGRDRDGDEPANGTYLYKVILKDGARQLSKIEKMVKVR